MLEGSLLNILDTVDGFYSFGYNEYGQLGLGHNKYMVIPTKIDFNHEVISFNSKSEFTILFTTGGLYSFCNNLVGQLGLGDNECRNIPTKLKFKI